MVIGISTITQPMRKSPSASGAGYLKSPVM
jgi:hypothetical protein